MTYQKPFITDLANIYTESRDKAKRLHENEEFDELEMMNIIADALNDSGITTQVVKVPEGHLLQLKHPKKGTVVDLRIDLVYPF